MVYADAGVVVKAVVLHDNFSAFTDNNVHYHPNSNLNVFGRGA